MLKYGCFNDDHLSDPHPTIRAILGFLGLGKLKALHPGKSSKMVSITMKMSRQSKYKEHRKFKDGINSNKAVETKQWLGILTIPKGAASSQTAIATNKYTNTIVFSRTNTRTNTNTNPKQVARHL